MSPRHQPPWFLALVALATACAEVTTLFPEGDIHTAQHATWPDFVDSVVIRDCPVGDVLVVDGTGTELDTMTTPADAGATLSLLEAMYIAENRAGPDTIVFDPEVFPRARPSTILIEPGTFFPINSTNVCIDGRGTNVVLEWAQPGPGETRTPSVPRLCDSQLIGLTLLRLPTEIGVSCDTSRVSGCRIGTDGRLAPFHANVRPWLIDLNGGTVGPGNVFVGINTAIRSWTNSSVVGNYFGYDPVSERRLPLIDGIDARGDTLIEGNVFATPHRHIAPWPLSGDPALTIRNNGFGTQRSGALLAGGPFPGLELVRGHGVIGPGNIIRGTAEAIHLGPDTQYEITRNAIFENELGIVSEVVPGVEPPTLTPVTANQVQVECTSDGRVEIFADADDQGELFLGDGPCQAATGASISLRDAAPPGLFLTATLTSAGQTSAFSLPVEPI